MDYHHSSSLKLNNFVDTISNIKRNKTLSNKGLMIKRWSNLIEDSTTTPSNLNSSGLATLPLDLSKYKTKHKKELPNFKSQASTSSNTLEINNFPLSDSLIANRDETSMHNNSKITQFAGHNLLHEGDSKDIICNTNNMLNNSTEVNQSTELAVDLEKLNVHDNPVINCDMSMTLNEGDYIYDNSIRIVKYIAEGAQAKVYIGLIEEIDKYVAIKRYTLVNYDDVMIEKIEAEFENVRGLEHPNIIKYFDIEFNNFTVEGQEYSSNGTNNVSYL